MLFLIIAIFFAFLMTVGWGIFRKKHRLIIATIEFCNEYNKRFTAVASRYFETRTVVHDDYNWLTLNANKMQEILGPDGVISYIAPYNKFSYSNYHIVINTVPKFKQAMLHQNETNSVCDSILRVVGDLSEEAKAIKKKMRKPALWLQQGFRELFSVPFYMLNWFGIISDKSVGQAKASAAFKVIVGIGSLVTFIITVVSGIATIIDSKATMDFIKKILGR